MRTPVHMDDDTIEDLAAGHDHLAIMTNDTGIPKVKLVNTRTMEERNHCTGCDMPRIGGTTLAVRDANGIYVEDLETGDDLRIEEENEILDIRTDGDNVAWSWIPPYNVDPITILNLKTGEMVTHQPDHLIFTFNMAEGQVLFLRSVVPLPSDEIDPAMGTICLAPVFLLCSIMSGVGLFAYNYKQKNIQKRIYQQQYQAYWNNYYNSYYYGFQRNNGVYEGHYRY
jgi:hypothetical protein